MPKFDKKSPHMKADKIQPENSRADLKNDKIMLKIK